MFQNFQALVTSFFSYYSGPEYTTKLQQVIAYKLIEFIQSIITQSFDSSIRDMGSHKPVKSMILQKYNYFVALQMFFRLVCPIQASAREKLINIAIH